MRARDILGPQGPLARAIAGYELREGQLRMADVVEDALAGDHIALVEAGTGTGKTLAYLIPALLSDKKIIVSTGTKTLQDQIMEHDLPLIEAHSGLGVHAACMKGLANYLCLRRYSEFLTSAQTDQGPLSRDVPALVRWRDTTRAGDRSELAGVAGDAAIWAHVTSGSDTRIGARCRHYEECFVTRMKRAAEEAQLVVVNHHLFFADLAVRGSHAGAAVLPEYDAVVFDEAHQLEDVATEFFGVRVSSARLETLVRDAQRALLTSASTSASIGTRLLRTVLETGAEFFSALPRGGSAESARVPLPGEAFAGRLQDRMHALDTALEAVWAHCRGRAAESEALAQTARRAQQMRDNIATIAEGGNRTHVTWTETRGRSVSIGASPVDVSRILREEVFFRAKACVMTSATLSLAAGSTSGPFDFAKQRLGIDFEAIEEIVASPFDYAEQAALYLPPAMPDPRDARYLDRAADEIVSLVELTRGGAFVLCTSYRAVNELVARVRPRTSHLHVLVQGDAPNSILLDRFRALEHAVLFATASFWEGVDVPGHALRLVVIDKLPFDVPSDPLIVARCERLRETGEQPFMSYLVPAAALALKQGFGRLIRTATDRGIVAILDGRITKKGYGKVFLRSLPPARRCTSQQELAMFWDAESGVDTPRAPDVPATAL